MLNRQELWDRFQYEPSTGWLIWRPGKKTGRNAKDVLGSKTDHGYQECSIKNKRYYVHRLVYFMHTGRWSKPVTDHVNGDRSDNRIENLREATRAQNQVNGKVKRPDRKYRGVFYKEELSSKPYFAQCVKDYKQYFLGYFATEEDAARAYDKKMKELFGVYARLNFPDEL